MHADLSATGFRRASSRVYYKTIQVKLGTIAGYVGDMRRQPVLVNGKEKAACQPWTYTAAHVSFLLCRPLP